ncbi:hypothetical protein IMZ29_02380 [Achromobacter sp. GG226]|uniref:hypothetical protein n=1 Tax=Verticiella alkaliphila TaxID=2779529 RepID=UPI001C0D79C2|nr:hypothetical protein [Verticiella sp. GG226]MBU4609434.1 hypothetical protein [Verticiella sp. GG226]
MPTFASSSLRKFAGVACLALGTFAASVSAQVPAQPGQPGQPDPAMLAQMGGMGHAVAKVCGGYTEQQLDEMKTQQRTASGQMGLSEADFDKQFDAGYEKASADIKAAGKAKQDEMCAQMKAMSGVR